MTDDGTTRRQYLRTISATTAGTALLSQSGATSAQTASGSLLEEDFEKYSVGSFPDTWSRSGNNDQQIVDDPAESGEKALRMVGSHGGCWHALAHRELAEPIPADQTVVFSGKIRPEGDGDGGCHGQLNGVVDIRSDPTAHPVEHRRRLLRFQADGVVKGGGELGSCRVGEYNSFEVEYYRDSENNTVELSYTINGEDRGETTVDATTDDQGNVVESDLVYLTVVSGDFTLYVDDLSIVSGAEELSQQSGENSDNSGDNPEDSSGIPVLNRFGEDTQSMGLGVGILGVLGAGGYALYRQKDDNQPDYRRDDQYD